MRIFSGVRPSGKLHIGNYLGAVRQWLELQKNNQCLFCVVDLHAITTPYNPKNFQKAIRKIAAVYLAAGLDSEKSIIFVQSQVKEHAELAWLLSTVTSVGDLKRMTQFKEKSKKQKMVNAGLLNYPILMASDILLYQTEEVPVGQDQKQHVELTREIARKFNNRYGKTFKLPKAKISKKGAKIMSLIEPEKKMSKTDKEESCIFLFDESETIRKKINSAQTDSGREIKYDPEKKAGISNLLTTYSLFSNKSIKELEKEFQGKNYKEFKENLAKLLIEKLKPFRERKEELEKDSSFIDRILKKGAEKAGKIAQENMDKIKKRMGLKV